MSKGLLSLVALTTVLHSAAAFTSVGIASKNCRVSAAQSVTGNNVGLKHGPNNRRLSFQDMNRPSPLANTRGKWSKTSSTTLTTSSSPSELFSETTVQPAPLDHAERYTSADWLRALLTIPMSNLLRRVSFHLFGNTLFAALVWMAYTKWPIQMKMLTAGFNPQHMLLLSNALALLLVFRTNTAYDRFWEARRLWGFLISRIREVRRISLIFSRGNQTTLMVCDVACSYRDSRILRCGAWTANTFCSSRPPRRPSSCSTCRADGRAGSAWRTWS